MRVIDGDGHVEENLDTFSDKYLDPAFRALRPRVTGVDGLAYWVIEEQLYPRRVGPGCHNLGTPTNVNGQVAAHTIGKQESIANMELDDIAARLKLMDDEDIAVQVIYTTLFLAYPLTTNVPLATALTSAYNRWMGQRLAGQARIKWSAVVNLDDIPRRSAKFVKQKSSAPSQSWCSVPPATTCSITHASSRFTPRSAKKISP